MMVGAAPYACRADVLVDDAMLTILLMDDAMLSILRLLYSGVGTRLPCDSAPATTAQRSAYTLTTRVYDDRAAQR